MSNLGESDRERQLITATKLAPTNGATLTWIDARMADEQCADRPCVDYRTGRWRIFGVVCGYDFMVQHESGSGDSMGGDDTHYPARAIAAAIERWSAPCVGVDAPPAFFEVLEHDAVTAEIKADMARVEAIRCRALSNSMRARGRVACTEAVRLGWSKPYSPSFDDGEAGRGN